MKTLLLNPPSFEKFDGGAGSRWPARREITSYWYPVWLAYPAGMIKNSRLLDGPPHGVTPQETVDIARDYEFVVLFTSTPGFENDIRLARAIKDANPGIKIAFVGPHVSIQPEESLNESSAIDFVIRKEFDFAVTEFAEGRDLKDILGVSYRKNGRIVHIEDRPLLTDLDSIPFVVDVYKRDLDITKYSVPFLKHPFISLYSARGCPALCTFCLWPQTFGGHRLRTRSSDNVTAEIRHALDIFPNVKEIHFDDDTFAWGKARVLELCAKLKPLKFSWSCNCRVNADYEMLKAMREAGCRLLIVGFESGDAQILKNIKKGATVEQAVRFMKDCKSLGMLVHGDYIMGLPGETSETIKKTIRFAEQLDTETIQVSIAHPFPGTEFDTYIREHGFATHDDMIDEMGHQLPNFQYPGLSRQEIVEAVEYFYGRYYFRPRIVFRIVSRALFDSAERTRLYGEAKEYLKLRAKRRRFSRSKASR
jgi:hopanoid biosynthesis associated radical SAM protein HpnJ